jgi:isoquinoline 1-oxidoreductase beta subunit
MIMLHYLEKDLASERRAPRAVIENVSRRGFLGGALTASGFVLAINIGPAAAREALKPYPHGGLGMPDGVVANPKIFIAIDEKGDVSIVTHRSEMGTGIRTSLPMVVADEMEADWSRVTVVQAPGDEPKYGNQDTDGSRSMRHFIQPMRQCGAAMRQMLEAAAAAKWQCDPGQCKADMHKVVNSESGESLGFGELAKAAMDMPVPAVETIQVKSPDEFRYMRKGDVKIFDLHNITMGKAVYGADIKLPGMKYAVMARPPVVGGKIKSVNSEAAKAVPGVEGIFEFPGPAAAPYKFAPLGGVAVVANSTYAAIKGREALQIEWENGPNEVYDSEAYTKAMHETAQKPGKVIRNQGDVDKAFAEAKDTFVAEYHQAHMAQAPMEPLVATARIVEGKVEVWAPVQSPYGARKDIAEALKIPIADVTVHVTLLGGGFGRKSKWDWIMEAVHISEKVGGAPVKLQWTREDDIHHSFYHTTSVERIEMALDDKGKVTGWRHRTVAPSIVSTFAPDSGYQFNIEYGMGFVDMPFEIANIRCENGEAKAHTRIGWFRSVSNLPRAFAVQSAVAELAHKLGRDPKDMLLELIGSDRIIDPKASGFPEDFWNYGEPYPEFPINTARLKGVVNLAAEKAGWGKTLPKGEGMGIAAHRAFASYVASVVHVKIDADGTIRVPEVTTAVDCGFYVNPERIRSQMEGAAVMSMSAAAYSGITYKGGAVEQSNYADFQVATMANYPKKVTTVIAEPKDGNHAGGIGEPGLPPFPPAFANAIFAATGQRFRSMPMGDKVKV